MAPALWPQQGDVVRVPAEGADVGLHPAKGGELVIQAEVPVPAVLGLYLFMGEIPQRPHPVVGEDRHGSPLGQGAAVEGALPVETGVEAAAVEEQDHRGSLGPVGGVDIQVQTVLGIGEVDALPVLPLVEEPHRVLQMLMDGPVLGAAGAEAGGVQHPVPAVHGLGVLKPPRLPEGHPLKRQTPAIVQAPYHSQGRLPYRFPAFHESFDPF